MTLPMTQRARQQQWFGRAATEAHVEADLVALSDRNVLDQQPDHAFALAVRRPRIIPQPWKVGCQGEDLLSLRWADPALVGLALPLVILLRFRQGPQLYIPFCFQRRSYESIVGVDAKKTAAG